MTVADRFGANLLSARRKARQTQEVLANRAALHRTEIGLLENGKRMPQLDTVMKLAGALEADPAVLLKGIVWMPVENPAGCFPGSHWLP